MICIFDFRGNQCVNPWKTQYYFSFPWLTRLWRCFVAPGPVLHSSPSQTYINVNQQEFTNLNQLFRQRFDACVNKSLMN
jgi:hypothetical protein